MARETEVFERLVRKEGWRLPPGAPARSWNLVSPAKWEELKREAIEKALAFLQADERSEG